MTAVQHPVQLRWVASPGRKIQKLKTENPLPALLAGLKLQYSHPNPSKHVCVVRWEQLVLVQPATNNKKRMREKQPMRVQRPMSKVRVQPFF